MSNELQRELAKRRTFAIISHPDAGKTTITEKLLLLGGAIKLSGTVKAKKSKLYARSDWMEIEKKRGISVTSSVLKFSYHGFEVNLIDTPGHQDFSEDTYRTLTAVDSVLMLIDAASGVEEQTKKLFHVCRMQKTPVVAFVNKMDREGRDPYELMDDIEKELGIQCSPVTWPTGSGSRFMGVYHRWQKTMYTFDGANQPQKARISPDFQEDLELLDGAGVPFSREGFLKSEIAPVFFGSAITGFGVDLMLNSLLDIAPPPQPRKAIERVVSGDEETFSAFIFKIQANMDPAHRDRVGFMRICSGIFTRDMKVHVVRLNRDIRLGRPTKFVAKDRALIDRAYPGDIVGVHDPGLFAIGDTLTEGEKLHFQGIPVFAPEHFASLKLQDPLKNKQLLNGLEQLSEEGAIQMFHKAHGNRIDVGAVGILQFDVVKFRLEAEYGVAVEWQKMPYSVARWIIANEQSILDAFQQDQVESIFYDRFHQPVILMDSMWRLELFEKRYPNITFKATSETLSKKRRKRR
ncbi:MAG: peptide chain release factor 3 [Proteobacteria bacterium]|nr:peptide chain release factor 3 [Pseudomonadota bacterium]